MPTSHSEKDIGLIQEAWDEAQLVCEEESTNAIRKEASAGNLNGLPCVFITLSQFGNTNAIYPLVLNHNLPDDIRAKVRHRVKTLPGVH